MSSVSRSDILLSINVDDSDTGDIWNMKMSFGAEDNIRTAVKDNGYVNDEM